MAVSSLQALNVIGLMEHIDEAITALGESGVFQPDDVSNFHDNVQDFTHLQTKNTFAEPLTNLKAALNQTKRSFPLTDVSDFSPSVEDLENFSAVTTADIDALIDKRETAAAKLNEVRQNLSVTSHFVGMGVEIEKVLKMKYMKARFGRLPKDSMSKLEAYRDNEYVDFAVCTEDKTHCWGVYFAPFDVVEEIDKIFEALFFERCNLVSENETPRERIEDYKKEIPALEANVKKAQAELDKYLDENKEQITNYLSKLEELYLYASIRSKALQYNNSFIIVGWVPTENKKQLNRRLKKIRSIEVDFSDAKNELDKRPPVRLKNCFLAKPFEFYTEMYGVPEYNEIDPTLFIAFTYVVIFGIMFADLGQGLLLSVVGILMWKIKKMKVGRILFPCGISAAIFGTVFGSVFGFEHLLDPMFHALGFEEKPMQVMNPENTNSVILTAISIGVILLIVAMFLNVFSSLRQKNLGKALFGTSGLSGIVFYGAAIFAVVAEVFLGWHVVSLFYILGLIVLPFILIFFAEPLGDLVNGKEDWQPESWGGYIVENIFESIEVLLGYVTNTMSFLRIGVFVLVHAGMMLVVFTLAETAGGEFSIPYWIIIIFGNALVMALEALLVSIQVLRLEYYEMFNRFYSGEGRPFNPVKLNIE